MSIRRLSSLLALTALLSAVSCAEDSPIPSTSGDDDEDDVSTETVEEPVKRRDGGASRSDASRPATGSNGTRKDAGVARPATNIDGGAKTPDMAETKGDAAADAAPAGGGQGGSIPCEVQQVLNEKCALCHGEEPASGAFPLTSIAQFQGPALGDESRKMYDVAHERVNLKSNKRMPPASVEALDATQLKTLSDWLEGGAQAGEACATTTPPATGDAGMMPGMAKGMGGAQIEPIAYDDPDLECHKFVAHARGDKTKPYSVPSRPDFYVAFNLKPTWQGTRYVRSFKNIIDNKAVIHHWLLFKQMGSEPESVAENALGVHPDAELLYGWAPGGDDMYFHPDVGMAVDGSVTYQLEAHYNNASGSPKPDASGVELCVTKTKPKNVAALSWVGTDAINGTTANGTCTPNKNQTIRLIAALPHMHTKGRHMKVVVNRKGGMKETIHDEEFDFEYQRIYPKDVTLQPGDTLSTTCTYSEPARFGKGTNDEMCYFFSIHWPANALTSSGGIGAVLHGPNSCLN